MKKNVLAILMTVQFASAFAHAADSSSAVQDLKKGDLVLKLDSASMARELATNQDVVIVNGKIETVVPALNNEIMCFVYARDPQQLTDGQTFTINSVDKAERLTSQRFYIALTEGESSDAESYSIGCRVPGLDH